MKSGNLPVRAISFFPIVDGLDQERLKELLASVYTKGLWSQTNVKNKDRTDSVDYDDFFQSKVGIRIPASVIYHPLFILDFSDDVLFSHL